MIKNLAIAVAVLSAIIFHTNCATSATRHDSDTPQRISRTQQIKERTTRGTDTQRINSETPNLQRTRSATNRKIISRSNTGQTVISRPSTRVAPRRATQNNANVARSSIVQTDTVTTPLYNARVSARVTPTSGVGSSVRARIPTIRVTNAGTTATSETTQTNDELAQSMDELAQMTDYCKAQYTECMDNFCNVLDDNQGRCSCSANLKKYAKTEEALKLATESLQDVAQQIQYIGLTSEEVETLFTQTEAELQMQKTQDNTQLKNDLDNIKDMILEVKSANATSSETSGLSMDLSGLLDFTIDSTGFDLLSMFGGKTDTSSISNQRGEELYKTATTRCRATVLQDCQSQGVDISVITNSYDLEIDKQCIAYERSLTDANEQMNSTVRNAKAVLQKARLLVAQQKNTYDMRGCINALDSCMQDDYVCGSDYENCLDPTGKYIVNGEIVVGSTPGQAIAKNNAVNAPALYMTEGLYATWNYTKGSDTANAWADTTFTGDAQSTTGGTLAEYIDVADFENAPKGVKATSQTTDFDLTKMSNYLLNKIGYHDDGSGRDYGMCMSVLNKCQNYTYEGRGTKAKYDFDNLVLKEYLQRTMTQIKATQDTIIADYAENCVSDVSACLAQNNYPEKPDTATAKANIAVNACRQQIATCMSVNGDTTETPSISEMFNWASNLYATLNDTSSDANQPQTPEESPKSETERCLANGDAKISANGEMCIIYGLSSESECSKIAQNNNSVMFKYMGSDHGPLASTGQTLTDTHCMYFLESGYNKYVQKCTSYGGTPSGLYCNNLPVNSIEECKNLYDNCSHNVMPENYYANMFNTQNRDYDTWPDSNPHYIGKDIRGRCTSAGMKTLSTSGNCVCDDNYAYVDAYYCHPCDTLEPLLPIYNNCSTCSEQTLNDLNAEIAYQSNGKCIIKECKDGYYKNLATNTCETSPVATTSCTSDQLLSTDTNAKQGVLYNGTCVISDCVTNYYTNDGKTCIPVP